MSTKIASIVGATGLIGHQLLLALLEDDDYGTIRVLIRRPIDISHPRLEKKIVDFNDGDSLLVALTGSHTVFCCIGTTQKKVKGDKTAYRTIDFDIPVKLARFCKMLGCENFVLVSSVGANPQSGNFYLRLKGEVEAAVRESGIRTIHIMRPSMLLGRRSEFRMGERIGQLVMRTFSIFIPSRYKPIPATRVAQAMVKASKNEASGCFIYHYADMQ
ncbi:MAG: NAD(P)H-binding protein [Terrimonas sp.]|nr:NAD(P)H-binding protein [Terrimonas sp.]